MRRAGSRGFTLVEIMVVILIIGLGIGIVSFNIGGNKPLVLRNEARQLATQLEMTASEATLGNEPWGLQFYRDTDASTGESFIGWRWLRFSDPTRELGQSSITDTAAEKKSDDEKPSPKKNRVGWQPEAPRDLDAGGRFNANIEAVLEIEGREVVIELLSKDERSAKETAHVDSRSAQKKNATKKSDEDDEKNALQPDVWLAPGGEMTPFVLRLNFAGEHNGPIVRGDALGRVEVETHDELRD
jgi:prepilin-type N-terminal cleavage/methylation domain-containing protein